LDDQNAGNSISGFQIFKNFLGIYYIPPISNDKLRLIFFFTFCAFFPSFISNTTIVRANLDAQNVGNSTSGFQISNIFWGLSLQ
jgi:hypothetical protein